MIDFVTILRDAYYCFPDIQEFVNHRYQGTEAKMNIERSVVKYLTTPEDLHFYPYGTEILYQVIWEYRFDDIKPTDVVLDLGANIGGFSLRAAKLAKHVYAVEPLFVNELNANIELNNLQDKITVLPFGVGSGERILINYFGTENIVQTYPLSKILEMIPEKVDFLKCDIEGAEWTINPEDIANIPRMEFEVHQGRDSCMPEKLELLEFIRENWDTVTSEKRRGNPGCYIHAYPKNCDRKN